MIERPENKSNHSKDVIMIKRDVSTGEPGNSGTFLYLRKKKNDNEGTPIPLEVPASSSPGGILWIATYLKNYRSYVLNIENYTCFNYYRLGKVAEYIGVSYDRGKQARKVFEELRKTGEVKIFVRHHKTYVCLTDKGITELSQKIEELLELRDYHASLKPQTHTSKLLQESFNPGETHYEENSSNTATQKARLAADSRIGLAGSQIGATKNSSSNEKLPSFYETPALRILVVDDEPDVVASFKFSFEDAGYKVDGFTDPLIALSKFKANIYDIVLLDIRMPELDGIELYERMMRINNKVLVFFVTAYEIYKEALERLFPDLSKDFLIRKPVEMNDLVRMVTTVCESLR